MSIKFFKDQTLQELLENIGNNLDCYRNGDFSDLITPESCHQSSELSFDHEILRSIGGGLENDAENCIKMFDALEGLTPKLAREKRLWCYLTHTDLLEYTRERWPIPDDDDEAITKIQNHFFIKTSRNYERDNAASRLWWSAFICKRAPTIDTKKALEAMLFKPDARGQLLDRTTTAVSTDLFEAILEKMIASFEGDQEFLKKRHAVNRPFMVEVNALGGYNLLNALSLEQSRECLKVIDRKLFSEDSSEDLPDTDADADADLDNDANVEAIEDSLDEDREIFFSKEELPLRDKLVKFDQEVIRPEHPNTDEDERVLSREMLFQFLLLKPRNMDEFREKFSLEDRDGISEDENGYVKEICRIIDEFLDR